MIMTREEIKRTLTEIIVDKLGVNPEEVTENANFRDDFGADSLDEAEMIIDSEMEFCVSIPDEEYDAIRTVGQAIDLFERKLSEQ